MEGSVPLIQITAERATSQNDRDEVAKGNTEKRAAALLGEGMQEGSGGGGPMPPTPSPSMYFEEPSPRPDAEHITDSGSYDEDQQDGGRLSVAVPIAERAISPSLPQSRKERLALAKEAERRLQERAQWTELASSSRSLIGLSAPDLAASRRPLPSTVAASLPETAIKQRTTPANEEESVSRSLDEGSATSHGISLEKERAKRLIRKGRIGGQTAEDTETVKTEDPSTLAVRVC